MLKIFINSFIRKLGYVIAGFIFALIIGYFNEAKADYPAPFLYTASFNVYVGTGPTALSACNSIADDYTSKNESFDAVYFSHTETQCNIYYRSTSDGSNAGNRSWEIVRTQNCANGVPQSGSYPNLMCSGSPVCTPPQVLNNEGDSCQNPPACQDPYIPDPTTGGCKNPQCQSKKGLRTSGQINFGQNTSPTGMIDDHCMESCAVAADGANCGFNNDKTNYACIFEGAYTGASCTGAPVQPPQDDPAIDCIKQGKSYGKVNGATVCVKKGTSGSEPTKSLDKSDKKETNATGTKDTKTERENDGNTTKETTTTKNEDGTETTETKEQDTKSFCEQNPNVAFCKEETEAKTECDTNPTGPTCVHFCDKNPDSMVCMKAEDYIGKLTSSADDDIKEGTAPTSSFSVINMPSNNSCPAPKVFSLGGHSVSISYQWICDYASSFKQLLMAWGFFLATQIVYAGILKQANPVQGSLF